MHVRVALDAHELIHAHAAGLADAPEIVALQIDEHDVLGALLRMGDQRRDLAPVGIGAAAARPRAGDRARLDVAAAPRAPAARARS